MANYRQKWHPGDFGKPNAQPGIKIGDVHEAMLTLPRLLDKISSVVEGIPETDYAMSVVSPFHAASKCARIPSLQPISTVTGTNFQDLGTFAVTGVGLWFTSYTCFNTPPWVFINGLTQVFLDQPPFAADVTYFFDAPAIIDGQVAYATRLIELPFTDSAELKSNFTFGVSPNVSGLFSGVRVVAGGYRFFKTSASTTESGVIKGYYSDRGTYVAKNLA